MRLHNRQIKGNFWSDPDLIYELNRDQRMFFIGLTQLAEDSGCLEYDPRSFKIILYPADNDINPEVLVEWTEKIIKMGKLIVYEVEGKKYLYIKNFPKHQSLRTPAPPEIPLPIWICWKPREGSSRYGMYVYESPNNYVATPTYPCSNSNIAIIEENRIEENRIEENRIEEKKDICENLSAEAESISPQDTSPSNHKKEIQEIMDFYNQQFSECWSSPLKLTKERYKHIRSRLKNFNIDDLKKAILNLRASPFHCGENDKGKVYATPEFLFRNDTQVDKWLKEKTMKGGADNGRTRTSQKPDRRPLTAEDYDEPEYRDLIRASDRKLEKLGVFKVPSGN